jgi:hypothetical protein
VVNAHPEPGHATEVPVVDAELGVPAGEVELDIGDGLVVLGRVELDTGDGLVVLGDELSLCRCLPGAS